MGRVKLPISRIVNNTNRQVTFSKRRNGILKKAYELAVLCDIDIALIMISPSGRISLFSGTRRIEDVMLQYFNFKDDENDHTDQDSEVVVNDRESVMSTLMRLKTEETGTQSSEVLSLQALEYRQEAIKLQQQLELARERLRVMEPDSQKFASLNDFDSCEERLSSALRLVEKRKSDLMRNECSSYQETVEQINTVVQYIINAQAEEKPSSIQNSEFGTWVDQNGHNGSDYVPLLFQNGMTDSTPLSQHADLAPLSALPIPKEEDGNHRIKTDY